MIIYAIIPARSGSKGLADKNIKQIGGKPLLAHSIEFAIKLNIDRVFCSTDSTIYAEIAKKTWSALKITKSRKAKIIGITSEGKLLQDCEKCNFDMYTIPAVHPPRTQIEPMYRLKSGLKATIKCFWNKNKKIQLP